MSTKEAENVTEEIAAPGCPSCGYSVESYDHRPGYQLEVNSPLGGKDWLVGTIDEIYDSPAARMADVLTAPKPNSAFTKVALQPCGHDLEGPNATAFLIAAAQFRFAEQRQAAEKVLETDRALLEAAETAGHQEIAARYRQAVHAGNHEVAGLRAALVVLAGVPS